MLLFALNWRSQANRLLIQSLLGVHLGESTAELQKVLLERPTECTKSLNLAPGHVYHISMNSIFSARYF